MRGLTPHKKWMQLQILGHRANKIEDILFKTAIRAGFWSCWVSLRGRKVKFGSGTCQCQAGTREERVKAPSDPSSP